MTDTYMQKYIGRNIYKVSNPPGGHSSIKIGWQQPNPNQSTYNTQNISNNLNRNPYTINNHQKNPGTSIVMENINNNINSNNNNRQQFNQAIRIRKQKQVNNKSQRLGERTVGNYYYQHLTMGNHSLVNNPNLQSGNANLVSSSQLITPKPAYNNNLSAYTDITSNTNTSHTIPFRYSLNTKTKPYIQQYQHFVSPSLIQPLNTTTDSRSHLYQWQQSTREMQEELKYYQQKNKALKEKLYGDEGFKYNEDYGYYQSPKRKRVSSLGDIAEELELALQQRYQYRQSNNIP